MDKGRIPKNLLYGQLEDHAKPIALILGTGTHVKGVWSQLTYTLNPEKMQHRQEDMETQYLSGVTQAEVDMTVLCEIK